MVLQWPKPCFRFSHLWQPHFDNVPRRLSGEPPCALGSQWEGAGGAGSLLTTNMNSTPKTEGNLQALLYLWERRGRRGEISLERKHGIIENKEECRLLRRRKNMRGKNSWVVKEFDSSSSLKGLSFCFHLGYLWGDLHLTEPEWAK